MAAKKGLVRRGFSMNTFTSQSSASRRERNLVQRRKSAADSREWVQMQTKTFTNWVNDRLKETGRQVEDLQYDLDDGLTLLKLVECLAPEKKLPK